MLKPLVAILLTLSTVAAAATYQEAEGLFAKGDFRVAADTAASLRTAAGFALAAKSISIYAATRPTSEQDALYSRAESLAKQAVETDAKYPEGYFERARALGRLSQLRGVLSALMQGYGGRIKDDLEKALALRPNYASAMVALAVWHAEIVNKGVAWLYGADGNKVVPLLEKAVSLEPEVVVHKVEYAKALLLLDKDKNREKARGFLVQASQMKPSDAAERLDVERAKRELADLGR